MDPHKRGIRQSLEVPGDTSDNAADSTDTHASSSNADSGKPPGHPFTTNGVTENTVPLNSTAADEIREEAISGVEKKNSLGRSGHVAAAANRLNRKTRDSGSGSGLGMISRNSLKRDSVGSLSDQSKSTGMSERIQGVELTDKPMEF